MATIDSKIPEGALAEKWTLSLIHIYNIRHLSDMEHVRTRPGMYIGKLGDGSHAEDGIYAVSYTHLKLTYINNKAEVGEFDIKLPVAVEYAWGTVEFTC